jgi:hypothetical protein
MKALLPEAGPAVLEKELGPIFRFYGISHEEVLQVCEPVLPYFSNYCELVFGENSFELITAGVGDEFATDVVNAANMLGTGSELTTLFSHCAAAFPDAVAGIKFCFSPGKKLSPTLYVRTKTGKEKVFHFLEDKITANALANLQTALAPNHILYGLGFSEKNENLYIKTYAITDVADGMGGAVPGFISWRLLGDELSREHKEYLPDNLLENYNSPDARMKKIRDFLLYEMGYDTAGHIGLLHEDGRHTETKIYIERTGGIPTDFSAR